MLEPGCCVLIQGRFDLRSFRDTKDDCTDCRRCGWNQDVSTRRKEYARRYGLLKGKDGLRYIPARPPEDVR